MLFHHTISVSGVAFILFNEYSGQELVASILGTEISNPFLQLRWFLREAGQYETFLAKVNDIIFMTVFICWRLGPGSLLWKILSLLFFYAEIAQIRNEDLYK